LYGTAWCLDIEAAGFTNRDSATPNTHFCAFRHNGSHHISGLKAFDLLLAHQVTAL